MATATFDPQIVEEAALDALSRELNIPRSEISIISTLPREWNDASLGCPKPGQVYPPVLTPGYQITLAVGDRTYQVHTDISGTVIICFSEESEEGSAVADPLVAEFIAEAKAQLAEELGIAEGTIALVRSEAVDWSDSSLGCAEPGQTYAQVITPGYRIVLAVDETRYEYHADQQRMFLCTTPTQ